MEWAFRVATDVRFGGGHIARCEALATAFGHAGALFADPGSAHRLRTGNAIEEEGTDSAEKAAAWLAVSPGRGLVIDSYSIASARIARAREGGFVAAFRDDAESGAEHVSINPNPGATERPDRLAGPGYFPLPSRFEKLRQIAIRRAASSDDRVGILVAFGQRDSGNMTGTAIEALRGMDAGFSAMVVLGAGYENLEAVCVEAEQDRRFSVRSSVADLAPLYTEFDLAIGAPGVSQFERACCGLPSILVPQNDGQAPLAAAWAETGSAESRPAECDAIAEAVRSLAFNPSRREAMRARAFEVVDARGAERLAAALAARAERI